MKLDKGQLKALSNIAIDAAKNAGHYIAQYDRDKIVVENKKGGETLASQVVTEVDKISQDLILEVLKPTIAEYDLGLLTEEQTDDKSRLTKDYFWCIDPLDGTLAFIRGQLGYSVSIALVSKEGIPEIGVIYNPMSSNVFCGIKDQGAYKNDVSYLSELTKMGESSTLTFVCDRSFLEHEKYKAVVHKMEHLADREGYSGLRIIDQGGAAMNAMWVMEHAPACYFKFPKKNDGGGSFWDYAASACIVEELGANVSDIFGDRLNLNNRESTYMNNTGILYASNSDLHEKVKTLAHELMN